MSIKTRFTKFYCTKVLLIVLLACINGVSSSWVSKGAARNSQTLETLSVDHTDISKRFLRSDTSMTTDGRTNNAFQERALAISLPGLEQATNSIKSGLTKLTKKLKLQWWRLRQKSPNDVFTLLKLDQTGDKLFESPVFSQWVAFVAAHSKNDPDMAVFSTLANHYADDALAKVLVAAKQGGSIDMRAIATKMEGFQITNWVTAGNSADDVFKALKLDQTGDKLFESPLFSYWAAFVAKRNTKNPGTEMFTTFTTHYSDDALAKMLPTHILATAKNVDSTKAVATKLEGLQITNWINTENSVDDVFKILKLDQTGDKLFESPVFSTWATFVIKTNKENPEKAMVTQLVDSFGDVAAAKMIAAASKVEIAEKFATDLRSAQFSKWVTQGKTPQSVDNMFNVATTSDNVMKKISRDYEKFYGKVKVTDST